nr:hypothetical protein [Tanacetum cinerariifolium]
MHALPYMKPWSTFNVTRSQAYTSYPTQVMRRIKKPIIEYSRIFKRLANPSDTPYQTPQIRCTGHFSEETDNPCTTMEEYVWFETERALKKGKVYNWKTAKYGKTNWCLDNVDIDVLSRNRMETVTSNKYEGRPKTFNLIEDKFDYIFDHFLSESEPFKMESRMNEKIKEEGFKLIGTPQERSAKIDDEFDEWARENIILTLVTMML